MRIRHYIALTALCAGLVFSGCSSSAPTVVPRPTLEATLAPASAPSATPESSLAPTPEPTLSIAELATAYLACADPSNKAQRALEKKFGTIKTLKGAKAYSKQSAFILGVFIACVRAVAWTPDVAGDAKTLVIRDSAVQITELQESRATSISGYNSLVKIETTQLLAAQAAANVLRGDLGLPPPPI